MSRFPDWGTGKELIIPAKTGIPDIILNGTGIPDIILYDISNRGWNS